MFPDEINWPEGEDAPPLDAQELITLLLRQNPLERMGAGTYEHKKKKRDGGAGGESPTHGTAGNSVRARQTQRATINSHVTAGATLVLLISLSHWGRNGGTAEQFILWPPHLFPLINSQLFPSPVCGSGSMHDQAPRVCCSVDCKNGRDLGQRSLITGMHVRGSVRLTAAPPYSSRSPIAGLSFTEAAALP